MKVYVDELPKSCLECNNENCEHQYIECYYEERHPNCPLQSLAEYTKQVRKEVCEEIKDKMIMYGTKTIYNSNGDAIGTRECLSLNEIKNILYQIQGETK